MKLFNELPTVVPFFTNIKNQNRFKENVRKNCTVPLFSPSDSFLPFVLKLPKDSPAPTSWKLFDLSGVEAADLSNNIDVLQAFNYDDFSFAYYKGEKLTFQHESVVQDLNMKGTFYLVFEIDGQKYFSETFTMCPEIKHNSFSDRFVQVKFWDEKDIEPIRFSEGFKQWIFLDTFIHESEPQIQSDREIDGKGNEIPTFRKMIIKQKIEVVVPEFIKIALLTVQLHDNVEVFEKNKRSGMVDRVVVTSASEESGSFATVQINFETDVLMKTVCDDNKPIISQIWI